MKVSEKLKIIQKMSGLNQTKIAEKIGVTFAALNRWINEQARPRAKMLQKIDELYLEYSGEKSIPEKVLLAKKSVLNSKREKSPNVLQLILSRKDILQEFELSLTYNSNRIEGSTLTENETAEIIFNNKALPSKSLIEQLEAKNHQTALLQVFDYVSKSVQIDEDFILKLHSILMNGIHPDAGIYRRHGVRIVGTEVVTANYVKIPDLMTDLVKEINLPHEDFVAHLSQIHAKFEQIHPFGDGNGRIGRLLITAMLLMKDFPPAIIKQQDRQKYFTYLSKAQIKGDFSLLEDFLCEGVFLGYGIVED